MSDAFRKHVRDVHSTAFAIHREVAVAVEQALLQPRKHESALELALNMLFGQAYKSHLSVWLLAEHGHIEDAATIARRLMELAAQAVYIGMDDTAAVRDQRAGQFCAHLWRSLAPAIQARLPKAEQSWWQSIHATHAAALPKESRGWGPTFREMFQEIGRPDTYEQDYSLLAAVAHGRPDELVVTYAAPTIRLHAHHHASAILVHSCRYYLAVVEAWNFHYKLMAQTDFDHLVQLTTSWHPEDRPAAG